MTSSSPMFASISQFLARTNVAGNERVALENALERLAETRDEALVESILELLGQLLNIRTDPASWLALLVLALPQQPDEETLAEQYGEEVLGICRRVRQLFSIHWDRLEKESTENLRQMFVAMAKDMRVVIVTLALRVHQMRNLVNEPDEMRRKKVAKETLEVFAPLANRLGVWKFKSELEDSSFRELDPEMYASLERELSAKRKDRQKLIEQAMEKLREQLPKQGIQAVVKGRQKHLYSIYMKMTRKGVGLDQIHDLSAVRVITEQDKVEHCYAALGVVHSLWVPMPGEFDDYIARAKENGYQSLHTTVMGPGGKPLEVQIRTRRMNDEAEYGAITHWAYKEGRHGVKGAVGRFNILRQLMDWEGDISDPEQMVERLKVDVFQDQVYVFTPAGDVVDLPVGSTPLDFAYRIHTQVGHRCRGAKVNDEIVPLDYQLETGDRVEILTQKKPSPSRDWMNPSFGYLHTASARTKVRQWFREQDRENAIAQGRESVERELGKLDLQHVTLGKLIERFGYKDEEDLFAAVGFGLRSAQSVASSAFQLEQQRAPLPFVEASEDQPGPESERTSTTGVRLGEVDDILGTRARCCNPVPGDKVIGYVSRGRGIIIHRQDCPNVNIEREPERWVQIDWGSRGVEQRHKVKIEIKASDRQGLLRDLSDTVLRHGATVHSVTAHADDKERLARIVMSIGIVGSDQLIRLLDKLQSLPEILAVRRIGS